MNVINPILFNASIRCAGDEDDDKAQRLCRRTYAIASENAAFCRASAHVVYRPGTDTLEPQAVYAAKEPDAVLVPVNVFDKIKVFTSAVVFKYCTARQIVTSSYGVISVDGDKVRIVFPTEVQRSLINHASVTRYTTATQEANVTTNLNVTVSRGVQDRHLILHDLERFIRRSTGGAASCVAMPWELALCNNALTVDGNLPSVINEETFKERALKDGMFSKKPEFKALLHIVDCGNNDELFRDSVMGCACVECAADARVPNAQHPQRQRVSRGTFRRRDGGKGGGGGTAAAVLCGASCRRKRTTATPAGNTKKKRRSDFMYRALAPLRDKFEVQVHSRCLNCSAVTGHAFLPALCKLASTLAKKAKAKGWFVDHAVMYLSGAMEVRTNGLLPAHMSDLIETLCWLAKTRRMASGAERIRFAKDMIEKCLARVTVSRRNFAQSGNFCQRAGIGNKYVFRGDNRVRLLKLRYDDRKKRRREGVIGEVVVKEATVDPDVVALVEGAANHFLERSAAAECPRIATIRRRFGIVANCGIEAKFGDVLRKYGGELPKQEEL